MSFPLDVYSLAAAGAFLTALATLPLWRRWCLRLGLVDDPGHRKIHHQPIPLAGGLTVMTALLLPLAAGAVALWLRGATTPAAVESVAQSIREHGLSPLGPAAPDPIALLGYGLRRRAGELCGILAGAFGMLLLGCLDDRRELSPAAKFTGQVAVAGLVAASGVRITLFIQNPAFHYAVTILWILTVINAFNFMDNMNGLCSGLGAIAALNFAVLSATEGQYLVALIALLTFGALLGFLPYNFPRASAFLGDAGSHLVGFLLAVLAVLPHFYTARHPHRWAVASPLLVLAVPLLDMAWVVVLRWRKGQPFYVGDTNHLSHRLVRRGLSPARAVATIWLLAAAIASLAYLF